MATVNLQVTSPMEALVYSAKDAGLPPDQVSRFIQGGYFPLPGHLPFHAAAREADQRGGPQWIAMGGKRGPGKSHAVMAQAGLDDCQRAPGLKILFLRKVMKTAAESLEDLAMRIFRYIDHSTANNTIEFGNHSRILLGGYNNDKDIEKYLGIEYDEIIVEESTQITEEKIDKLRGSLRTSRQDWRPRIYLTTNADGVGLGWFKKRFVEPFRKDAQTITRFFDVSHIINPFNNPEYDEWLDSLTGPLRKAWRDGDWDAFAGMAFPMWDRDQHVISPIEIPSDWTKWRAVDWGYAAPWCCLWFARDPDTRRIYVTREAYAAGLSDRQQAERIVDMTPPSDKIGITFADPSMWERKSKDGMFYTTADEYRKYGVMLAQADNDRIGGKRKMNNALSLSHDNKPGMMVFDTCTHLIDQLSTLAGDPKNPEDVDTEQEDHAYDTCRYGLSNERRTDKPPKRQGMNPLEMAGL